MLPTTIHEAPALNSFTTLDDHQSFTPRSFYNGKPVLHYHAIGVRAQVPKDHISKLPIFAQTEQVVNGTEAGQDGTDDGNVAEAVDVFVTSEYVSLAFCKGYGN